ncbi:LysR family transcriptional regulator [bacterium]|nr:LysR family transcriptional regulator [bacterium]
MFARQTLNALITLASIGNFKGTAATLGISPVKVTRLVQRAEEDCGFQIFERSKTATIPTTRGQQLLEACKELSIAATTFDEKLEVIQDKTTETLRISCGPLATHTVLLPILRQLLEDRPGVTATVTVSARGEPIQQLRDGETDLFIGDLTYTTAFEDISVMVLEKRDVVFVARPGNPVFSGGPYTLAELLQKPLALPHIHRYWQTTFNDALKAAGSVARGPQIESDDYQTLVSLAATTDVITAGTQEQLEDALASGRLAQISMRKKIQYNICCACRDPHAMETLELVWGAIADNYRA